MGGEMGSWAGVGAGASAEAGARTGEAGGAERGGEVGLSETVEKELDAAQRATREAERHADRAMGAVIAGDEIAAARRREGQRERGSGREAEGDFAEEASYEVSLSFSVREWFFFFFLRVCVR